MKPIRSGLGVSQALGLSASDLPAIQAAG